jgi:hypothetical protein
MIEVGLQEVPRCPENISRRLREFDRRLRCEFNVQQRVWQIQEQVKNGSWTHVCWWADGPWHSLQFRPLPFSAEPLIQEVIARDITRSSSRDVKALAHRLDAEGAVERSRRLQVANKERKDKMRRYAEWAYRRAADLLRMYQKGGRSRTAAIRERVDVLRDLGLRRE